MRKIIPFLLLVICPIYSFGSAAYIEIPGGERFFLELPEDTSCSDLLDYLGNICEVVPKKTYMGYRDYSKLVTPEEKDIIHYILKTISQKSIAYLLANRSSIEKSGVRIEDLHPLRFLECIFSDEELKTYIHGVKSRGGWVWKDFIKELKGSLEEETMIGNMTDAILINFSCVLNLDINLFYDLVRNYKWDKFIKVLLDEIPRSDDNGRYDQ